MQNGMQLSQPRPLQPVNASRQPALLQLRPSVSTSWHNMPAVQDSQLRDRMHSSRTASTSTRKDRVRAWGSATDAKPLTEAPPSGKATSTFMQERMEFLQEDLSHLFDDKGLDQSQYDDVVKFRDPITRFNSVKGYMFNISMLKRLFAPIFQLHDIRQTGEYEITTRWTMKMQFTLNRISPLRRYWDPALLFTGVSIMGINPDNGKVNKHIDLWDAVRNNTWFSFEAAGHVGQQMGSLMRVPDLESFSYTVLRKSKDYEIRRYEPFNVIETQMDQASSRNGSSALRDPAAQATNAFRSLAGFLFGKNKEQKKYSMTMPVITDTTGLMRFILPSTIKDVNDIPEAEGREISSSRQSGGLWAAQPFGGVADSQRSQQQAQKLHAALRRDGITPASDAWALARYNDPSTKPWFRRNDVLTPVAEFDLWNT